MNKSKTVTAEYSHEWGTQNKAGEWTHWSKTNVTTELSASKKRLQIDLESEEHDGQHEKFLDVSVRENKRLLIGGIFLDQKQARLLKELLNKNF